MANQDALSANGRIGNVIFAASWVHEGKSIKETIAVEKPAFNEQEVFDDHWTPASIVAATIV
jgi:hypothetical protein